MPVLADGALCTTLDAGREFLVEAIDLTAPEENSVPVLVTGGIHYAPDGVKVFPSADNSPFPDVASAPVLADDLFRTLDFLCADAASIDFSSCRFNSCGG